MRLFDEFKAEHLLVDRVAGSLIRFAEMTAGGESSEEDVADFVEFFRVFVAGFHHEREEQTLFPVLVERAEVPADRGPLPSIEADHRAAAILVDELEEAGGNKERLASAARRLAHHLWEHVDKEDSVLFPESFERLRRNGVTLLEGRESTAEEEAARGLGEQLTVRFPPLDDPEVVRGDGCVACSAFGETCGGIETEWWNTWEHEYHRSLDEG
ncbi:MAG: hemerythrin domain-containing protein [Acidobacteria bacterium]|nr:hemerythrin domain-containing protein [Candidatus Sulfomarinibacter kjeldsenii]